MEFLCRDCGSQLHLRSSLGAMFHFYCEECDLHSFVELEGAELAIIAPIEAEEGE